MLKRLLVTIFLLVACGMAQEQAITIVDESASSSPVKLSGIVTFSGSQAANTRLAKQAETLTATNISGKPIIAMSVRLDTTDPSGYEATSFGSSDYFFQAGGISPGERRRMLPGTPVTMDIPAQLTRLGTTPTAKGRVLFVQFVDGSTWGNEKDFAELTDGRRHTYERLQQLVSIYTASGDDAFRQALLEDQSITNHYTRSKLAHLRDTLSSSGVPAALAGIKQSLAAADAHKDLMASTCCK
jgi:hypothetical protein